MHCKGNMDSIELKDMTGMDSQTRKFVKSKSDIGAARPWNNMTEEQCNELWERRKARLKRSNSDFRITEDDFNELNGILDLGFRFDKGAHPALWKMLPALELCYLVSHNLKQGELEQSPTSKAVSGSPISPLDANHVLTEEKVEEVDAIKLTEASVDSNVVATHVLNEEKVEEVDAIKLKKASLDSNVVGNAGNMPFKHLERVRSDPVRSLGRNESDVASPSLLRRAASDCSFFSSKHPQETKAKLKLWAKAIAFNVKQSLDA